MIQDTPLVKLIRLCSSISSDSAILSDLRTEIESQNDEKIVSGMIKKILSQTNLENIGMLDQILPLFFQEDTITEIDLFGNSTLGIKCFFMSKGTYFPLHDHPNEVVATTVLYGNVKYLCLETTEDDSKMKFGAKGLGTPGKLMFNTKNFLNVHTIYAQENSVILDIFMSNVNEPGNFYKVVQRSGNFFSVIQLDHIFFRTRSWKMQNCECLR